MIESVHLKKFGTGADMLRKGLDDAFFTAAGTRFLPSYYGA